MKILRRAVLLALLFYSLSAAFSLAGSEALGAPVSESACKPAIYKQQNYTVCHFTQTADIRLFWGGGGDKPFASFNALEDYLQGRGETLVMAMNGGMYHANRNPVGLYLENGNLMARLHTKESYGNFGLLPNGVFFIKDGKAQIMETLSFKNTFQKPGDNALTKRPEYASQSGPMLVIDGHLHPKFRVASDSRKRRNGVGVTKDGQHIYFVISDEPVNFYSFGSLFKDYLKTPNALYLDGVVSRLYDAQGGRSDPGLPMGPIVGVVRPVASPHKAPNNAAPAPIKSKTKP